jgi:hypothetical protein
MRAFIASVLLSSSALANNSSTDIADIQRVMDNFHDAVVSHDGPRLSALFIPEGSTWLNVLKSPRRCVWAATRTSPNSSPRRNPS